jgi:hypothetical protein
MRGERVAFNDLHDAAAGVGLIGGIVAVWHALTGRNDKRIREVAEKVYADSRAEVRLTALEVTLPRIDRGVSEVKETCAALGDKIDDKFDEVQRLLLGGRLPIKRTRE